MSAIPISMQGVSQYTCFFLGRLGVSSYQLLSLQLLLSAYMGAAFIVLGLRTLKAILFGLTSWLLSNFAKKVLIGAGVTIVSWCCY